MPTTSERSLIASLTTNAPTVQEIEHISKLEHTVLRNLLITQSYCELSKAFSFRTGVRANWCTFATWASKQAGVTIRGEDLQRRLEQVLKADKDIESNLNEASSHIKSLGSSRPLEEIRLSIITKLVQDAVRRASDAVARGNKKVFEEIGREFARFIATCFADKEYSEVSIQNFCKELRDGDPPDGQDYLRRAFTRYYQSFFEPYGKKRQELQLLSNLEIGFHEQTRLQPEIAESLNAALVSTEQIKQFVANVLLTKTGIIGSIIYFISILRGNKSLLNRAIERLVAEAGKHIRALITAELMTLTIPPNNCLRLGKDINTTFPADLQQLTDTNLLALLTRIDPTTDSLEESGATDWANLNERLHYIADMFRCYHEEEDLFLEAFSAEQVTTIKEGKVPDGRL